MKKNQTKKKQLILQKRKNMCNEIEFRIWDKENKTMKEAEQEAIKKKDI